MLRRTSILWRNLFVLTELSLSAGLFLASYALRFVPPVSTVFPPRHEVPPLEAYIVVLPAVYVIVLLANGYFRLYHPRRVHSFADEALAIAKANLAATILLMTVFFMDRSASYARGVVLLWAVLNPIGTFAFRVLVRTALRLLRSRGYNLRHVLVVGIGRAGQQLVHSFRKNPWTGIRVVGFVGTRPESVGRVLHGVPVIAHVGDLSGLLDRERFDHVYIALAPEHRRTAERALEVCAEHFVATRLVEDPILRVRHPVTIDFGGLRITSVWENHLTGNNAAVKRVLDIVVASIALVILAPLFALIALAVATTSRGPVFYRQRRMGLDGRLFTMVKFRTMKVDAAERGHFTQPGDDRCTRVGRFLRRTSLDELPQLVNVVIGEMSLVGPRPERPVYIERFRSRLPRYMLRHRIKAGMTGWAQINGWRGDSSLKKRLQYDLFYMHNWSLWFDIKILLLTFFRGWTHPNAY